MLIVDFAQQKIAELKRQVRSRAYDYVNYNVDDNQVRVTFCNNGKPVIGPIRRISLHAYIAKSLTPRFSFSVDACEGDICFAGTPIPGLLGVSVVFDVPSAAARKIVDFRSKRRHKPYEREVRFAIHDGKIWVTLWSPGDEWTAGDRNYSFDIEKLVLGETLYSSTETDRGMFRIQIEKDEPMYEGEYRASISTWRYARFPFIFMSRPVYKLDIGAGIPIPGKGENSWDCDEDAIYGISTCAADLYEAVEKLRDSVNESRRRYGGAGWRPSGMKAESPEKGPDDTVCVPSTT